MLKHCIFLSKEKLRYAGRGSGDSRVYPNVGSRRKQGKISMGYKRQKMGCIRVTRTRILLLSDMALFRLGCITGSVFFNF